MLQSMNIGFVVSQRGKEEFEVLLQSMIAHLESKNHKVVHMLDIPHEQLHTMDAREKEQLFQKFLLDLHHADILIAESTYPSHEVGFYVSSLVTNQKPVIILSQEKKEGAEHGLDELICAKENVGCFLYPRDSVKKVLDDALSMLPGKLDKRFTIIFPAHTLYILEKASKRHNMSKAVYIRQVIEKHLAEKEHLH